MPRRDVRVHARERAERLRHALFGLRPRRQIADAVAQLGRLLEKDAIRYERPADLSARVESVDAPAAVVPVAQARSEPVRAEPPAVAAAARLDHDQAGREPAVLHRIWIWEHHHRLDRIVGQRHLRDAGRRIHQRRRPQLDAGLTRPSAFDAHATRHRDDGRQHAHGALKALPRYELVELAARDGFDRRQRLAARHRGRLADNVDRVREFGDREIDANGRGALVSDDDRSGGRLEAVERGHDPVGAGRQAGDLKAALAVAGYGGHDAARGVDDLDVDARERRGLLRRDGAANDTATGW